MFITNWPTLSSDIRRERGNRCELCGRIPDYSADIHHIFPRSLYPELRLDKRNLIVCCKTCHDLAEKGVQMPPVKRVDVLHRAGYTIEQLFQVWRWHNRDKRRRSWCKYPALIDDLPLIKDRIVAHYSKQNPEWLRLLVHR